MKDLLNLGDFWLLPFRKSTTPVAFPAVTENGALDVSTFKIGTPQTITAGLAQPVGGGSVSYAFRHLADDAVRSTAATYAHRPADDARVGLAQWRAIETGGTQDGTTPWQTVGSGQISHAAPVVTGVIDDQSLILGQSEVTIVADVAALFTGEALSFENAGYAGLSLDGGQLRLDPAQAASGVTATLTALNSGGRATQSFTVDVTALGFTELSLGGNGLVGGLQTVTAAANQPGASFSYDWRDEEGTIGAPDQNTLSVAALQDGKTLFARVTVSVGGVDFTQDTNAIDITLAAPTLSLTPRNATVSAGTQAGSTVASLSLGGGAATPTLSGPDAGLFILNGTALDLASAPVAGSYSVTVNITNSGGSDSALFDLTVAAVPGRMPAPSLRVDSASQMTASFAAAPEDGGTPITGYDLRYRETGGNWTTVQDITSPHALTGLMAGRVHEVQIRARNATGAGAWSDAASATTEAGAVAATLLSVEVGAYSASSIPVSITTTGAQAGDGVYWIIVPAEDAAPTATEIRNGQAAGGGLPMESGNDLWPGPFTNRTSAMIDHASCRLYAVIDNGALSNVGTSNPFTVDTVAPVLSLASATGTDGDITWSVNSGETVGVTVFAAYRAASEDALSKADIETGTGSALGAESASVASGGLYDGRFAAPADGSYVVDMFARDAFDNETAVVSSTTVVIASSALLQSKLTEVTALTNGFHTSGNVDTVVDFTTVAAGDRLILAIGGQAFANPVIELRNGGGSIGTFTAIAPGQVGDNVNHLTYLQLDTPAAAAGQAAITLRLNINGNTRPVFAAVLSHIEGSVGSVAVINATGGGTGAGTVSTSIDAVSGGLLYAMTTGSLVSTIGNLVLQDAPGSVGTLDASLLAALRGTDDVYKVSIDNNPMTETGRTVRATHSADAFNITLSLLSVVPA